MTSELKAGLTKLARALGAMRLEYKNGYIHADQALLELQTRHRARPHRHRNPRRGAFFAVRDERAGMHNAQRLLTRIQRSITALAQNDNKDWLRTATNAFLAAVAEVDRGAICLPKDFLERLSNLPMDDTVSEYFNRYYAVLPLKKPDEKPHADVVEDGVRTPYMEATALLTPKFDGVNLETLHARILAALPQLTSEEKAVLAQRLQP